MSNNQHNMETGENQPPHDRIPEMPLNELYENIRTETKVATSEKFIDEFADRLEDVVGSLDQSYFHDIIITTVAESTPQDYYQNLKRSGASLEQETRALVGGDEYYKDEKLTGIKKAAMDAVGKELQLKQIQNLPGLQGVDEKDWSDSDWDTKVRKVLRPHSTVTVQELKDLYGIRKRVAEKGIIRKLQLDPDYLWGLVNEPTSDQEKEALQRKAIESGRPEFSQVSQLPKGIGAVFWLGAEHMAKETGLPEGHAVNVYRLINNEGTDINWPDIDKYLEDQMYAFNRKAGESVAGQANAHLSFFVGSDLRRAFNNYERGRLYKDGKPLTGAELVKAQKDIEKVRKGVDKVEDKLNRAIALHGLVRDMEASEGSITKVMGYQLGEDRGTPITDNVTGRKDSLLMENGKYLLDLLYETDEHGKYVTDRFGSHKPKNSEIVRAREMLLEEMGIGAKTSGEMVSIDADSEGRLVQSKVIKVDVDAFKNSDLFKYIYKGGGGFNGWIEAKLKAQDEADSKIRGVRPDRGSLQKRWMDLKTACDIVMATGEFTQWSALLPTIEVSNPQGKPIKKFTRNLSPANNWGGDPLMGILRPSNLPRNIKGMYDNPGDEAVMNSYDQTYRPTDIIKASSNRKVVDKDGVEHDVDGLIPVSFAGSGSKVIVRFGDAMFSAIGKARANGLPDWGKDGLSSLDINLEMLDQVYGNGYYEMQNGTIIKGKELVGIMMARLLATKAEATVLESAPPTAWETTFGRLAVPEIKFMPNAEALTFLLGPDLRGRSGFIAKIMGGRTRIEIKGEAEAKLRETILLLKTNDQRAAGRALSELFNILGFMLDIAYITSVTAAEIAGADVRALKGGH